MKRVYLIALIVALMAGSATFVFAKNLINNQSMENSEQVLCAIATIPAGALIEQNKVAEMFELKPIAKQYVDPGKVVDPKDIVGKVLKSEILAGEQVSYTKFMESNSDEAGLSFNLEKGEVAYSIVASGVQGVDGYIKAGDTIDILVKGEGIVFENLEVLRVATNKEASEAKDGEKTINTYTSFTLRIDAETAESIYEMENTSEGEFKFILHSKVDAEEIKGDSTTATE
jgi:Flp pilus assembly protein CpaB